MKQKILNTLFLLVIGVVLHAQTSGELSVSVKTSSAGGNYAPKNIVAIWVEDVSGNFVKTLLAYADKRITHLNTWQAATTAAGSEFNKIDAITGATKTSHDTRTCTWNGTDFSGTEVSDGVYQVKMELTDKNATGNYASFTFTKGSVAETLTPADVPSFATIAISWVPATGTAVLAKNNDFQVVVYPNPGTGVFSVTGADLKTIEVYSLTGELLVNSNTKTVDISTYCNGVYIFKIQSPNATFVKRVIKR